ncbi:MAG: DUF3611 family protein [Leptolyngbyaceae cyanobacterium]
MLVRSSPSEPPPAIRKIASTFRLLGWVGFWVQLAMAFVSGIALVFSGLSSNPAGTSISIFWAMCSLLLLALAIVFDFQYVRVAKGLLHEPGASLHPKRAETAKLLRLGAITGFVGMLLALIGSGISVTILLTKTISQPPGAAIVDPSRMVRALDVFVVVANLNLIAAHLVGTVIAFWLLDRVHLHHSHHA